MNALTKSTCVAELQAEPTTFSHAISFLLRQTTVSLTWIFGRHFLENEQNKLSFQKQQLTVFVASGKLKLSKRAK